MQEIYLKDIPLRVVKDYIFKGLIESQQFQNSLNLYDRLNTLYHELTELDPWKESSIGRYALILEDVMVFKYLGSYPTSRVTLTDLMRLKLELQGQSSILTDSISNNKISRIIKNRPRLRLSQIIVKSSSKERMNENLIRNSNRLARSLAKKDVSWPPPTSNAFLNVLKSLTSEIEPTFKNLEEQIENKIFSELLTYPNSSFANQYSNTIDFEEIALRLLTSSYSSLIELCILKYKGIEIDRFNPISHHLDIFQTFKTDLIRTLRLKFIEGSKQEEIFNVPPGTLQPIDEKKWNLDENNVSSFISFNDMMNSYTILKRKEFEK